MLLVAVDPGLRCCGVAVFEDGRLVHATLARNPEKNQRGPTAWRSMAEAVAAVYPLAPDWLVLEVPQVYRGAYSKGDPADLIELAGVDGAIVGLVEAKNYGHYLPKQWAGSVPKDVRIRRLQATWTPEEEAVVEWPSAKSLAHNVWDAIALGRFACARLGADTRAA